MTCETETGGLGALIHVLGETNTKAVIATLDSSICEVAAKLAHLGNKPLLTWTCPLVSVITGGPARLSAPLSSINWQLGFPVFRETKSSANQYQIELLEIVQALKFTSRQII